MDPVKEAFQKIKEEILFLTTELSTLKKEISSMRESFNKISTDQLSTNNLLKQDTPTNNPTLPQEMRGSPIMSGHTSTGNEGVPTVNPTYTQTNQHATISSIKPIPGLDSLKETLNSLDSIKKEIRLKFKRLTNQEMIVFSLLYSLENQGVQDITYRILATELNLSESSIRDYINKLLSKGIPILKRRVNNKTIVLNISKDLQKIAPLSTIIKLRDI